MKKLLLIIITFFIAGSLTAQKNKLRFGLKAGTNIGKIYLSPVRQNRTELNGIGIIAGGFVQMPISKKMKLQIESLYNLHNSTIKFNPSPTDFFKTDLSLHQISVPVQLCYFIIPNITLNVGVSANYNFYLQQKAFSEYGYAVKFNITDEIKKFSPGFLAGIIFNVNNKFSVEARYNSLLNSFYKKQSLEDQNKYYLGYAQVALGYHF